MQYGFLNNNQGCGCCNGRIVVTGVNDVATIAPQLVKYFQGGTKEAQKYTTGSAEKIYPICTDCGKIKEKPMSICTITSRQSIGCKCGDGFSYPEKVLWCLLDQIKIYYEKHYTPPWLVDSAGNQKEYDTYLPAYRLIVEMDGPLGHGKSIHPKSKMTIKESLEIDRWKDDQAAKNNLKVIRINADKSDINYLKEQIEMMLGQVFNLKYIDWALCDEKATKNIVKEVCIYYEKHKPIITKKLGEIFELDGHTITRYLKKGAKYGWCTYTKEEMAEFSNIDLHNRRKLSLCKPIDVYRLNTNEYLGTFNSSREFVKMWAFEHKTKLNPSNISSVLHGKRKSTLGLVFKYAM